MKKNLIIAALCLILGFLAGSITNRSKINSLEKQHNDAKILAATRYLIIVEQNIEIKRLDKLWSDDEKEIENLYKLLSEATAVLIESANKKPGQTDVNLTGSEQE